MDTISQTTLWSVFSWIGRIGDKPLSERMMVRLPTHICVARPQWVKRFYLTHKYTLRNRITCHLFSICSLLENIFTPQDPLWHSLLFRFTVNIEILSTGKKLTLSYKQCWRFYYTRIPFKLYAYTHSFLMGLAEKPTVFLPYIRQLAHSSM